MVHLHIPVWICFSFFVVDLSYWCFFSQCFFPQLLVEPGTKRFKSFNCKQTHSTGTYLLAIVTIRHPHKQIDTYSRTHHVNALWTSSAFSRSEILRLTDERHLHWQMQWPTQDLSPLWLNVPHQSISHQRGVSRYWQAVHCLHFPSCFQ